MKLRHKRSEVFFCWMERLLWMAGCAALAYCAYTSIQAGITQARLSRALERERHVQNHAGPSMKPVTADATWDRTETNTRTDAWSKDNLVGRLSIPRLGLSAMVLEGDDVRTLRVGLGHIPGTAEPGKPGNVGIAGHRDTFLQPLRSIDRGDRLILETVEKTYRYRVSSIEIVETQNVSVLAPGKDDELTLVTCYPFSYIGPAPKRFIVHADAEP